METISNLSGHWVEFGAAVYLAAMILYGHYKGFIRLAISVAALFITLVTVRIAAPYAADWLKNDTPVYENIRADIVKTIGLEERMSQMEQTEGSGEADMEKGPSEEEYKEIIGGLDLPEQLKKVLIDHNNGESYQKLGVELFQDYVGGVLAETILQIVVFVALFVLVRVLLHILMIWLNLLAKLPILSGMNQIAGAILGGVEGVIFLWIACLVFTALSGTAFGAAVLQEVDASTWLSWLYDHNLLTYLAIGLIKSVF